MLRPPFRIPASLRLGLTVAAVALALAPAARADSGGTLAQARGELDAALAEARTTAASAESLMDRANGGVPADAGAAPAPVEPGPGGEAAAPTQTAASPPPVADPSGPAPQAPPAPAPAPAGAPPPSPPADPAPSAPSNTNVVIRILSPGDDGPVSQTVDSGGAPAPAPGDAGSPPGDWNWTWNWDTACDPPPVATAADWNWTWNWTCGGAGDQPAADPAPRQGALVVRHAPRRAIEVLTEALGAGGAIAPDRVRPARRHRHAERRPAAPVRPPAGWVAPVASRPIAPTAVDRVGPAPPRVSHRRAAPDRGPGHGPLQRLPMLPFGPFAPLAAASAAGGFPSMTLGVIAGLLAACAATFFTRLRLRRPRPRSRLSNGRLERPG